MLTQKKPMRWKLLAVLASPQLLKVTKLLLPCQAAKQSWLWGADPWADPSPHPPVPAPGGGHPRSHDLGGRENDEASHVESFHHQERKQ